MHLPANCRLGKEKKQDQQKMKPSFVTNSATIAAAAASMVDPHFQALIATLGHLQGNDEDEECWCAPACMWIFLLACMAGPIQLDTGPTTFLTYLLIIYFIIINLLHSFVPKDPKSRLLLMMTILRGTPWPPQVHRGTIVRRKHRQKVRPCCKGKTKLGKMLRAHLFAMAITSFRVGCCIELHLHHIFDVPLHLTALLSFSGDPGQVRFDSNSFPICVVNHASYCMANSHHLFKNLVLSNVGKVDVINEGLEIAGKGTFMFKIVDDARAHIIHIPNLLYLPELKSCLLSPQHWVQEAGDGQTWMVNLAHHCILQWADGRKTVPYNKCSNTPIFYTVSSSRAYQAFAGMFEALEAPFFQRETVIQIPGCRLLREDAEITPEEFVAKEDLHCGATKKKSSEVDEVDKDNNTVCTSNIPPPPEDPEEPDTFI
jgi:hypothetical protein